MHMLKLLNFNQQPNYVLK